MAAKSSKLEGELSKYAIKLLRDTFRGNKKSRSATPNTTPDGLGAAQTTDASPPLTEKVKVFEAVTRFWQAQARLQDDDDPSDGSGSLADLQRRLHGSTSGGGPNPTSPARRTGS
jgi:hypothetical protein